MQITRSDHLSPAVIRDPLIETHVPADVGLSVSYPWSASSVWPTAQIHGANVRGQFQRGIVLDSGCWNATLTDCFVNGSLAESEYSNPQAMQVGIDLDGAMDCHILRPRVTSAGVGIRASTAADGFPRCEGLHVEGGFLMHVHTGIECNGSHLGGWPTPAVWAGRMHVNFLTFGFRGHVLSGVHLEALDLYASHLATGQWGVYLTGCKNVEISGCHFWANRPGFYGGIVLDQCETVHVSGGVIDAGVTIALYATPSCRNVTVSGPAWAQATAEGKVANYAGT